MEGKGVRHYQVTGDVNLAHQVVNALYQMKIQSVLVEGGARLLQSFIDEELWDEIRVIKNEEIRIKNGLAAPGMISGKLIGESVIMGDSIKIYQNELG